MTRPLSSRLRTRIRLTGSVHESGSMVDLVEDLRYGLDFPLISQGSRAVLLAESEGKPIRGDQAR